MSIQSMIERNQEFEKELAMSTATLVINSFMPILTQINETLQEIRAESTSSGLVNDYHKYFMDNFGCDPIMTQTENR